MKRATATNRRKTSSLQRKKSLRKGGNRIPLTASIVVTLLAIYSAVGFIAVPYYCSRILPKRILAATGLYLHSAALHFNPYTFNLTADGVSLEDTGERPIIFIDKINTRLALLPLLRAEWVCRELMLRRAQLNIVRIEKNRYNISKLLSGFRDSGTDDIMDFSELPFYFSLNNIDVQQADILFTDQLTATTHHITDISLRIPTVSNFSYKIEHYLSPYFSATVNGTEMEMIGKRDGNPQMLTATLSNLSLERYQPYLPVELPFALEGGRIDGTIDIDFINFRKSTTSNQGKELALAFDLTISDLGIRGKKTPENALFKKINLAGKYQAINNTLTLDKARFISPQINCRLPSRKNILVYFLDPDRAAAQADTVAAATAVPSSNIFSLLLKNLLISQGKVVLTADSERETWENITLQAENLHADTNHAEPEASDRTPPGSIRMRAQYAAAPQPEEKEEQTTLYLQTDLSSYHGSGAPRFANMTVEIENLHDPKTIFRSLGLDIGNDDKFSFAARKTRLGPINTHTTPYSLGKLSIAGGKIHTIQDKPPLFLQLLLQTSPPFFHLPAISYQGSFTLDFPQEPEKTLSVSDLSFSGRGIWGETMTTSFTAFLSPGGKEGVPGLARPQIEGEGRLTFIPLSLQTKIKLQDIALGKELPPFLFAAAGQPLSGTLSATGELVIPKGDFRGNFTISSGAIDNSPTATTWGQLDAEGADIGNILNGERAITLDRMTLRNLRTTLILDNDKPPLAEATRALNMFRQKNATIRTLQLAKSEIAVEDRRITPFWQATITNVSAAVTPLQTAPAIESEVHFIGNLQQGVLEARGTMQLDKPLYDARLSFTGRDIANSLFGRQLPRETLLNASDGTTDFSLNTLWINDKMSSRGKVLFSGIKAASEKTNIETALAIAGGTQQKFALEVELSAAPGERTTPLYYTFYRQLHRRLLKAEVSPLLLADKEFHPLAREQDIRFQQGKKELTGNGEKTLKSYFRLLERYPQLALTMTIKESKEAQKEAQKLLADRLKYLETRYSTELSARDAARISLITKATGNQQAAVVGVAVHPLLQKKTARHKQTGGQ